MATVNFYLNRSFKKDTPKELVDEMRITGKIQDRYLHPKETTINIMVTVCGKLFKVSTNERILPKLWDFRYRRAKANYTGSFELNMFLETLKANVLSAFRNAIMGNPRMSAEEVRELIRNSVNNIQPDVKSNDFLTVYQEFLNEKQHQVKPLTLKKYKTLLTTLTDFMKHGRVQLCFHHINQDFDRDFKKYLIDHKRNKNNTVDKYYDNLKVFMKWAEEREYHRNNEYSRFKTRRDDTDIVYLTELELDAIYNLELYDNTLVKVRDIFCFQALTGQRFSDIANLKVTDIYEGEDGIEWHLYQIKGNKSRKIIIPLTERAIDILKRYQLQDPRILPYVFPTATNTTTNRHLKEVCKQAGLNDLITIVQYSGKKRVETTEPKYKLIGTHCARRTFVTLSLEKGLRPEVIQAITGHEDYKVMRRYIKITEKVVKNELLRAWHQHLPAKQ